ncbi:MAG: amidohydrolase, partial [Sphingomonas sp.]
MSARPTALLLAAALVPAPALADAIVDNVRGVTLDAEGRVVRFRAIVLDQDGKVVRLVRPDEKEPEPPRVKRRKNDPPLAPRYAWRADLKGRVVMPGFVDAHGHVLELGFRQLELDLSGTRSLAEAQARIRAYAAANPDRKWIVGGGWNQESWGLGRFPTAADLDAAVADRPVYLA